MKFKKDADLGRMAYDTGRSMRAALAKSQPKPSKPEKGVISAALSRLKHDSARKN